MPPRGRTAFMPNAPPRRSDFSLAVTVLLFLAGTAAYKAIRAYLYAPRATARYAAPLFNSLAGYYVDNVSVTALLRQVDSPPKLPPTMPLITPTTTPPTTPPPPPPPPLEQPMIHQPATPSPPPKLHAPPPRYSPVLLALGDSLTDGGLKARSYRYHLHQRLSASRLPARWVGSMAGVFDRREGVDASSGLLADRLGTDDDWPLEAQLHEGHWGWTTAQVLEGNAAQPQRGSLPQWLGRLRRAAGASAAVDIALVLLGTNDLTQAVFILGQPVATVTQRVRSVLHQLCELNPAITLLLATPPPYCRQPGPHDRASARPMSLEARRAAEAELGRDMLAMAAPGAIGGGCASARLLLVNLSSAVGCHQLVADGVHPSESGARAMADAWYDVLAPLLGAAR